MQVPVFVVYIYLFASIATFLVYGWDKWQAKKEQWRVPEKWLHTFEVLGGWPGGILGQLFFRHKTSKFSYQIIFWLIVSIHLMFWYLRFKQNI